MVLNLLGERHVRFTLSWLVVIFMLRPISAGVMYLDDFALKTRVLYVTQHRSLLTLELKELHLQRLGMVKICNFCRISSQAG